MPTPMIQSPILALAGLAVAAGAVCALLAVRLLPSRRRGADGAARVVAPPELRGMLAKLDSAQRLNARQYQLQRAQFELHKRMRGDQDPAALAASILEFAGEHYDAPVGAFYLARPGQRLELAASFGCGDVAPRREFRLGQGLVGRAALRRRAVAVSDVDAAHLQLDTALGSLPPCTVVVAPFHLAGEVKGVLELGVPARLTERDLDLLKLSAESVAMALDSARSRARVHRLLEETRRQAAVLAEQQRELQASNERLAQSDRYKSEFLANMSHELRTPLNSMLIMSQVLAENRGGRLDDDEVEAARTINRAGSELLTLINDILDMSVVESGRLEVHPEAVDPRQLVQRAERLFRPVARREGLEFRVDVAPDTPAQLVSDPLRVGQILKNLLSNAFKFTAQGTVVLEVGTDPADGDGAAEPRLAFTVRDTGIGMDAATQARIFDVFRQGDGSVARRYGGSGLGLSISRRLAELLDGTIDVESAPGTGSAFTLRLPLRSPATASATAAAAAPAPAPAADSGPWRGRLAGRTALLADRDMRTVYELSHLLDAMGARVLIARGAAECGDLLAAHPEVDLVLMNPALRREDDGPCCVEEVWRRADTLTGILLCDDAADAPPHHPWPVLTKPVPPARVAALCARHAEAAATRA